jgi:hypothetical protein
MAAAEKSGTAAADISKLTFLGELVAPFSKYPIVGLGGEYPAR